MELFPIAGQYPAAVGSIDPVPAGEVVRQASPLAPGSQTIENGVDHLPARRDGFSSFRGLLDGLECCSKISHSASLRSVS